jgi:hypothetical protein
MVIGAVSPAHAAVGAVGQMSPWHATPSPSPGRGHVGDLLDSVSCTSGQRCVAVGSTDGSGALVLSLRGGDWHHRQVPGPRGASLVAVACPAPGRCLAVGSSDSRLVADQLRDGRWRRDQPRPAGENAYLAAVSCDAPDDCWAVGQVSHGSAYRPLVEHYRRGRWQVVATPKVGRDAVLSAVACPSASECYTVGSAAANDRSPLRPLIERWNGTRWSRRADAFRGRLHAALLGVACPTVSRCYAAGNVYPKVGIAGPPYVEQLRAGHWRPAARPGRSNLDVEMGGISCSSPAACTAVGTVATATGDSRAFVLSGNGRHWRPAGVRQPSGDPELTGVSCPTDRCYAVGTHAVGRSQTAGTLVMRD